VDGTSDTPLLTRRIDPDLRLSFGSDDGGCCVVVFALGVENHSAANDCCSHAVTGLASKDATSYPRDAANGLSAHRRTIQ